MGELPSHAQLDFGNIRKQKKGRKRFLAPGLFTLAGNDQFVFLRILNPASPARPMPNSNMVAGSGTSDGCEEVVRLNVTPSFQK